MKMIGSAKDRSISRTIFPTILISVILTSVFVVPLAPQGATENPMLRLDPSDSIFYTNQTTLGDRFNVTVWFENTPATSIYNFQVDFTYDGSILNVTSWYEPTWDPSYVFYGKSTVVGTPFYYHDSVLGKDGIVGGICLIGGDTFSGQAGKLCVLELQITRVPTPNASLGCVLGFRRGGTYGTYVLDPDDHELQGIMQDGSYLITDQQIPYHDIAVSNISPNRYFAIIGELVNIRVNLTNLGDVHESSNVTVYADTDTAIIGDEIVVGTQAAEVPLRSSALLDFSWNTSDASPGSLTISAMADTVPGETDISNNILIDGTVAVVAIIHDIAVTYIRTSEQFAYVGDMLNVEVDVQNQGNSAEQTAVYAYAAPLAGANIAIGTSTISLTRYISRTMTFMWNTTGLSASNYSLSAFAAPVSGEADLNDNNLTKGLVVLYTAVPCPDINITFPTALTVNPSIFTYDPHFGARLINIGNISVVSTGFAGGLRVVGSTNGTIHLCVDHPGVDEYPFYLPLYGEVQVPLWLMFQPETHWEQYNGDFTLNLTVCGTHRLQLTIRGISILVCQNGAYVVYNQTATFSWNLTGGSLVYLVAEPDLPPGWTYSVNPAIGILFETPHTVTVNITAPPNAKEGEMGRVTLKAYKNATGALIWHFIFFASTDNKPPTIESVETPTLTPDGCMIFNATIKDPSGIANAMLHYAVNGGQWNSTAMQWAAGDSFNSTTYIVKEFVGTDANTIQYYVSTSDWLGNETSSSVRAISIINDLAITDLSLEKTSVPEGYHVTLNVTVANQGTLPLSFANIVLYANATAVAARSVFNLQNGASTVVNFSLTLPEGGYVITALASYLPGEYNTANNARSQTICMENTITILDGELYKTIVGQGYCLNMTVTVANLDTVTKDFAVQVYANETLILSKAVTLGPSTSTKLNLTWNTNQTGTPFPKGHYTLSARAQNSLDMGEITVGVPCDVSSSVMGVPDGICNMKDIAYMCKRFLTKPSSPDWNPNCDVSGSLPRTPDGTVNMRDIGEACSNFNKT